MKINLENTKDEIKYGLLDIVRYEGLLNIIMSDDDGDISLYFLEGDEKGEHNTYIGTSLENLYSCDLEIMELVAKAEDIQITWKDGLK